MRKINILMILFCLFLIVFSVAYAKNFVKAMDLKKCPARTTAFSNSIIFVGKLDDLGNDKFANVWFEFGEKQDYLDKNTKKVKLNKPGIFCLKVNNLKKCENYYYRAVAQNIKGISYGEIKKIQTKCK